MSIYLVEANKASCRVSGCACRDRVPRYPSDLTDEQWELLEPEARAVMAELAGFVAGHGTTLAERDEIPSRFERAPAPTIGADLERELERYDAAR